ncbi:AraC family transcriptional regulator [Staphylospora marina]|uniref:AraC family transcriptional regulator n=1 Tax=Staphylospora marina TaxID=2490858 RepID=UPI000F5B9046|nr:AraC family transcriptional regulator [Staphylospora marina]
MNWVETLHKAIDFMESHLPEPLTVDRVAGHVHLSPFHFQRAFSLLTGMTVGEYIRRRRLTLAAEELCRTDAKVIDIALKYGYDTPEAFAKAFRRQHGITPSEARNHSGPLVSYNRLVIELTLKGAEPMKYKIVERDEIKAVGIPRRFSYVDEAQLEGISRFWAEVNRDGTAWRLSALNTGELKGLMGVCVDLPQEGQMDYWIAAETKDLENVPDGLSILTIPAAKWVVFEVTGAIPRSIQEGFRRIFSEWLPSSGFQPAGAPILEVYPGGDVTGDDYRCEIWLAVK